MKRALDKDIFEVNTINPRDYTLNKHKKVDDTPYGGGAGMVLMVQPYVDAYESIQKAENSLTIMLSPQGEPLNDKIESADEDTFSNGLIEYSHYTKPREYRGLRVPDVLLNGNHKEINEFRLQKSIERTKAKRPDLYKKWQNEI